MLFSFDPVAGFSAKKKKNMGVVALTKLLRTRRDLTSVLLYFLCAAMPQRCGLLPWTRVITGLKPYTQIPSTEREELLSGLAHCYAAVFNYKS